MLCYVYVMLCYVNVNFMLCLRYVNVYVNVYVMQGKSGT